MTITSYYVTHKLSRSDADANAIIHRINDLAISSGENRSWDATRALVNELVDPNTQERVGLSIEAEQFDLEFDD